MTDKPEQFPPTPEEIEIARDWIARIRRQLAQKQPGP